MLNRKESPYIFMRHLHTALSNNNSKNSKKPFIYFSLGTAVMGNLWNQQVEVREQLNIFIYTLTKLWEHKNMDILFVNLGKEIINQIPFKLEVVPYAA
ncbi:unnamed protein product [Rotaria sp. Silwood2]|nr:unnamed protein product [Rotaria sp. Silwood2]CAF3280440.1 unnamed protein product [Rotaria sp. Silwood2]CAF4476240.1 unnamed protein product [Rotaria sp. Silwood2]CAF4545354.1 unnamed protein product [Rotaria sp. Silwood2]CAF4643204.1 unnamed protein product [Rotaria sp. Silwood2]